MTKNQKDWLWTAIIIGILCGLFAITEAFAQGKPAPKSVKDTVINKVSHPLYVGAKGGRYIIVKSKTTGKEYKRYFKK